MNIIITGASRGVGYETVKQFCQKGDHHIIVLARSEDKMQALIKDCTAINANAKVEGIVTDLASFDDQDLKNQLLARFSQVDVLINNAGALVHKPIEELTDADIRGMYEVNIIGVMRLIRAILPLLKESQQAHILNISSMGGVQGTAKFAGLSGYSSSKGALSILTECLAEEFKEESISVNALAFGAVQTEMLAAAFPGYEAPLTAEQMGIYVADFALSGHGFYNGKVLPVALSTP